MTTGLSLRKKEQLSPSDEVGQENFCKQAFFQNDVVSIYDFSKWRQNQKRSVIVGSKDSGTQHNKKVLPHSLKNITTGNVSKVPRHKFLQHEQEKTSKKQRKKKNKTEELEVVSSCRVTELWWGSSHCWGSAMDGNRSFKRHRLGTAGWQAVFYSKEQLERVELCHEMVHKQAEGLQVRIKGRLVRKLLWCISATINPDQGVK